MPNRAQDWLQQALRDIAQAGDSRKADRHEWACFAAQQAAEKAVKGLHQHVEQERWGHVVAKLLRELPEAVNVPEELIERGRVLDNFCIPSRYPHGHAEGSPFEHFGTIQSEDALAYARAIIEFVRAEMAGS